MLIWINALFDGVIHPVAEEHYVAEAHCVAGERYDVAVVLRDCYVVAAVLRDCYVVAVVLPVRHCLIYGVERSVHDHFAAADEQELDDNWYDVLRKTDHLLYENFELAQPAAEA